METRKQLLTVRDRCNADADYYEMLAELNPERAKTWAPTIANYRRYAGLADARLKTLPETDAERAEARKEELKGQIADLSLLLAADVAGLRVEGLTAIKREYADKYNELRALNRENPLDKKKTII